MTRIKEEAVDQLVISQSEYESAWDTPVLVKRSSPTSLSIPGELAARVAFVAKLHHESRLDRWIERVLRERVEIEEFAFSEAKKEIAS